MWVCSRREAAEDCEPAAFIQLLEEELTWESEKEQ